MFFEKSTPISITDAEGLETTPNMEEQGFQLVPLPVGKRIRRFVAMFTSR